MEVINTIDQIKIIRQNYGNKTIGFVPTMGALHEGHLSLIQQARQENDIVIVSIFVNPTQFLEGEDLEKYPKKEQADIKICQLAGVDYLFMPTKDTIYTDDEIKVLAPNIRGYILEGYNRPSHFDGVLTIVLKLFGLIQPTNAYFGKKDAQQLSLIQQMVDNLFLPINIKAINTKRDSKGLALSSRNAYLTPKDKEKALLISKSLNLALKMVAQNELDVELIKQKMYTILDPIEVEYIAIVNYEFKYIEKVEIKNSIVLVAAKVGSTRLIDNMWM